MDGAILTCADYQKKVKAWAKIDIEKEAKMKKKKLFSDSLKTKKKWQNKDQRLALKRNEKARRC